MNQFEYDSQADGLLDEAKRIETAKRPAYTLGNADVHKNFKFVAERAGVTPMQVWLVYFLKHIDAITSAAKDPNIPQAEALLGRFADAVNYLRLGYTLYLSQQEQDKSTQALVGSIAGGAGMVPRGGAGIGAGIYKDEPITSQTPGMKVSIDPFGPGRMAPSPHLASLVRNLETTVMEIAQELQRG